MIDDKSTTEGENIYSEIDMSRNIEETKVDLAKETVDHQPNEEKLLDRSTVAAILGNNDHYFQRDSSQPTESTD